MSARFTVLTQNASLKKPKQLGTPCKCKNCGWIGKVRFRRGVTLKQVFCWGCGRTGEFERYTKYDQEQKLRSEVGRQ